MKLETNMWSRLYYISIHTYIHIYVYVYNKFIAKSSRLHVESSTLLALVTPYFMFISFDYFSVDNKELCVRFSIRPVGQEFFFVDCYPIIIT